MLSRELAVHRCGDQLAHGPDVIGDSELHGRRDPQRFMDAAEVVMRRVSAPGALVVAR